MKQPNESELQKTSEAVIRRVDPVARELTTQAAGTLAMYYVPPNCDVRLRGERVKLRMIQPGDRVRVVYTKRRDARVARSLEVFST